MSFDNPESVCEIDCMKNVIISHLTGNRLDTPGHPTVVGWLKALLVYLYVERMCYPSMGEADPVETGAGAWVVGDETAILPATTITEPFQITDIDIVADSTAEYGVRLKCDGETFFERKISLHQVFGSSDSLVVNSPICPANSAITAEIASSKSGTANMKISIHWHPMS